MSELTTDSLVKHKDFLIKQGDYDTALFTLDNIIATCKTEQERLDFRVEQARIHMYMNRFDLAISLTDYTLNKEATPKDQYHRGVLNYLAGISQSKIDRNYYEGTLKIAQSYFMHVSDEDPNYNQAVLHANLVDYTLYKDLAARSPSSLYGKIRDLEVAFAEISEINDQKSMEFKRPDFWRGNKVLLALLSSVVGSPDSHSHLAKARELSRDFSCDDKDFISFEKAFALAEGFIEKPLRPGKNIGLISGIRLSRVSTSISRLPVFF